MRRNILLLFFVTLLAYSCSNYAEVESIEDQNEKIESYLESNNYDYTKDNGLYKVVTESENPTGITLSEGDSLYFYFVQYLFNTTINEAYYTNIYSVALASGMQVEGRNFDPRAIEYGTTELIEGYQIGFNGAMQGDTLTLIMTSDLAYGDKLTSTLPKNQSIASIVIIEKIVK